MFGNKQRRIEHLEAANVSLQGRIQELEGDPYVVIAREVKTGVDEALAQGGEVTASVEMAVQALKAKMLQDAITAKAHEAIAAEKAIIDEQIHAEANRLAAAALAHFMEHEAAAYREQQRTAVSQLRTEDVVGAARAQIADEERQVRIDIAKEQLRSTDNTVLKRRAQELRKTTKTTKLLTLQELYEGDPLTICFVKRGAGFDQLTEFDSYQSRKEERKVAGHLIEPSTGLFTIEKDSWLDASKKDKKDQALRGGQQIHLLAPNHLTHSEELEPVIAKGEPMHFRVASGEMLPVDLDVWWVRLGNFRVLS